MRYLIALGGNAFTETGIRAASREIARLHNSGNQVVVTHGNGPQVGALYLKKGGNLSDLTRETQITLGKQLRECIEKDTHKGAAEVILTKVVVSKRDPEFSNPTKPIGLFYKRPEDVPGTSPQFRAIKMAGGYRLVVPSPFPRKVLESSKIKSCISSGKIAIAAGGGGSAVFNGKDGYLPADAVIDKDLASARLAIDLNADIMAILTRVRFAYTGFGTRQQKPILRISVLRAQALLRKGTFEEGSMKPKVESCIYFSKSRRKPSVIGSMASARSAVEMKGTVILP